MCPRGYLTPSKNRLKAGPQITHTLRLAGGLPAPLPSRGDTAHLGFRGLHYAPPQVLSLRACTPERKEKKTWVPNQPYILLIYEPCTLSCVRLSTAIGWMFLAAHWASCVFYRGRGPGRWGEIWNGVKGKSTPQQCLLYAVSFCSLGGRWWLWGSGK